MQTLNLFADPEVQAQGHYYFSQLIAFAVIVRLGASSLQHWREKEGMILQQAH